ncbi:MAG: sigma-70 family RNA polymerase sigma factor [Planctomycetes bacterium]|nr:sigma-70 family RNA polymerase sigma factor [Planctomycetota bacterium]
MSDFKRKQQFDIIVSRYSSFLEGVLWKLTGDRDLFAESMQNALLAIWRNVETISAKGNKRYIYRVAQSAVSRAWKQRPIATGESVLKTVEIAAKPDVFMAQSDEIGRLRSEITALGDKQCQAIIMRYLQEMGYDEIADAIGCSVVTARSHVSKGLAVLRKRLAVTR